MRFEEARAGERDWWRKVCCGGGFPSPGGCLRASVSDGANVRCRSEVPVIVRFG